MAHRFRFFADTSGTTGDIVALAATDVAHARVLRLERGDVVDLVTADGRLFDAVVEQIDHSLTTLRLAARRDTSGERWHVDLLAGVLTGAAFDELVDGAVQAGASRIIPVAATPREAQRIAARHDRLRRIAANAAKQAKRQTVPEIAPPVLLEKLLSGAEEPPGIVLDAGGTCPLAAAVELARGPLATGAVRLLVGPSRGFDSAHLATLVDIGWRPARLAPTVLRSELAAAVAVSQVAAQMADAASTG